MEASQQEPALKRARVDGGGGTPADALVRWCLAGGAELTGIGLAAGEEGRGFVAERNVAAEECVLKLPHALVLSTSVALGSAIGQRIAQQPTLRVLSESSIDEERKKWEQEAEEAGADEAADADDGRQVVTARSVLYAYLIHQRSVAVPSETAGFTAYARALPDSYSTPFSWPSAELARHADLQAEVASLETHLRGQYEALFPLLISGSSDAAALFPAAVFTWEAWLWAHASYQTRCFPRYRAGSTAIREEDGVLLPLVDMLNHDHSGCNTALRTGVGGSSCTLGGADGRAVHIHHAPLRKGETVLCMYSYGVKRGGRWACFGGCRLLRRLPMPLTLCRLGCLYRVDRHALLGRRQLVIHPHYTFLTSGFRRDAPSKQREPGPISRQDVSKAGADNNSRASVGLSRCRAAGGKSEPGPPTGLPLAASRCGAATRQRRPLGFL